VAVVEPTGPETIVMGRIGPQSVMAAFKERHAFKPGTDISLAPDFSNLHLFDAGTGKRL
jgi:multiple sugar transport system ATP-binding protein